MTILVFPEVKPIAKHLAFFHSSSHTLSSQYLLTISCSHPLLLVILAPCIPLFNKLWLMQFFLLSRVQSWGTWIPHFFKSLDLLEASRMSVKISTTQSELFELCFKMQRRSSGEWAYKGVARRPLGCSLWCWRFAIWVCKWSSVASAAKSSQKSSKILPF